MRADEALRKDAVPAHVALATPASAQMQAQTKVRSGGSYSAARRQQMNDDRSKSRKIENGAADTLPVGSMGAEKENVENRHDKMTLELDDDDDY